MALAWHAIVKGLQVATSNFGLRKAGIELDNSITHAYPTYSSYIVT